MSILITNIAELHTRLDRRRHQRVLRDAALVLGGERIAWIGAAAAAPAADERVRRRRPGRAAGLGGLPHAPGLRRGPHRRVRGPHGRAGVRGRRDCRTTVAATREAGDYDLTRLLLGRAAEAARGGTTYLETKTGYGLDVEEEARHARIASTVADEVTYLGAHLVPAGIGRGGVHGPGLRGDAGARSARTCSWADVFCERGAFTEDQSRRVLAGLPRRRAGAARARQPARPGPRGAAGGRIRRRPAWTT